MSPLGIGHKFTLLWYHPSQSTYHLSIFLLFLGAHRGPKGRVSDRPPRGARPGSQGVALASIPEEGSREPGRGWE